MSINYQIISNVMFFNHSNSKFKPTNITAIWYTSGVGEDDDGGDDV